MVNMCYSLQVQASCAMNISSLVCKTLGFSRVTTRALHMNITYLFLNVCYEQHCIYKVLLPLFWCAVCQQGGYQVQANEQQWACENHQQQCNTIPARLRDTQTRRWVQNDKTQVRPQETLLPFLQKIQDFQLNISNSSNAHNHEICLNGGNQRSLSGVIFSRAAEISQDFSLSVHAEWNWNIS